MVRRPSIGRATAPAPAPVSATDPGGSRGSARVTIVTVAAALCAPLAGPSMGQGSEPYLVQGRSFPDYSLAQPQSPVLTLDQERLFAESAFGRRVLAEIEEASAQLVAENRRIEAELVAEERDLTERRPNMAPEAFRDLADAFDAKAVGYRRQQDAKARALQARDEAERTAFFRAARPVLSDLVAELGGVVLLDDRGVLLASPATDLTDRAIARVDAVIGDGASLSPPGPILPEDGATPAPEPISEEDPSAILPMPQPMPESTEADDLPSGPSLGD